MKGYIDLFVRIIILSILVHQPCISQQFSISDVFGRSLENQSIQLVDWEGYIANPAIQLNITAPSNISYPTTLTISANHSRLYFDMPSTTGSNGPTKTLNFDQPSTQTIYLSIFPDRANGDESYSLSLQSPLGSVNYDIFVVDQDKATTTMEFDILFDYTQDIEFSFFSASERQLSEDAANDWAYFIEDMNFDSVEVNDQSTFIWNENFQGGRFVQNSVKYSGFLMYFYGLHVDLHRSGGAPSTHAFHTISGSPTSLRRSGSYNADPHGNFNNLGWNLSIIDDTWYIATNLGTVQNDLYSIALHEIGHAITFNPGYPLFSNYKNQGFIDDSKVIEYHQGTVPIDNFDHLNSGSFVLDRISKRGVFGSEYAEEMPLGRWLITKLNLLILESIGYTLRETSPFQEISILNSTLINGSTNDPYMEDIMAEGGIPFYNYTVSSGELPDGLSLNAFNGSITGVPSTAGTYDFTIKVEDHDLKFIEQQYSLTIEDVQVSPEIILEQSGVSIFRYPVVNELKILISSGDYNVSILDGNENLHQVVENMENCYLVEINTLPTGKFFLQILDNNSQITTQLILKE